MQPTVPVRPAALLLPGRVLQTDLRDGADPADTEADMKTPPPEFLRELADGMDRLARTPGEGES